MPRHLEPLKKGIFNYLSDVIQPLQMAVKIESEMQRCVNLCMMINEQL